MNLDHIELAGVHHMPDPDLTSDGCRRISQSWSSLGDTARAAGDIAVGLHHDLKASEYLERARRIEREAARKETTNGFLEVIGARIP